MRFLGACIKALILIIFGYWLAASQIASNTLLGDSMDYLMNYLPVTSSFWDNHEWSTLSFNNIMTDEADSEITELTESSSNDLFNIEKVGIDDAFIRERVLNLTNELRKEKGLNPLTHNAELEIAGNIRAEETTVIFSHTRPNGQNPFTVLEDSDESPNYNYQTIGENLCMATYHRTDEYMAGLIFEGWVNSEGHYKNMIKPEYSEMGVGVAFDGDKLYITQFFGNQLY